jgi:hypothetical protein
MNQFFDRQHFTLLQKLISSSAEDSGHVLLHIISEHGSPPVKPTY